MEVTLKNLKSQSYTVTATTVEDLKVDISKKNECKVEEIKCIYQGRVLENHQKLAELNYDASHYIIYMISKVMTAPKVVPKSEPNSPVKTKQELPQVNSPLQPGQEQPTSDILSGEKLKEAVEQIKAMGFNEADIAKAMKKAFNHPDRAIEYLLNGDIEGEAPVATTAPSQLPQMEPEEQGISMDADQESQMQQLMELMQSNPEVLQQLIQSNPQIGQQVLQYLQAMQQHQQNPEQGTL